MKFPVIYCRWLHVNGIALFPFILTKYKMQPYSSRLVLHERIHIRQQMELLVIPFYLLYLIHYLTNFLRYRNHRQAYLNIVFEKEAYANDANPMYLQKRRFWAFINYF